MNVIICPGSIEVANSAKQLFDASKVAVGGFREPIVISNITEDEAKFAQEFFSEQGKKVRIES